MIKFILFVTFIDIFFTDWLVFKLNIGNRYITWIPEFIAIFLMVYIAFLAAIQRQFHMKAKYVIFLVYYIIFILFGMFINHVPSGVMFAGMRTYYRFIPYFFLPAVYNFKRKEFKWLMVFLLLLSVIQCPVSLYQRFVSFAGVMSGDPVGGTVGKNASSVLSIYLIFSAAFLIAYYLRDRIPLYFFLPLLIAILVPTTLNETKGSFFLIPFLFILPFLFSNKDRFKLKKMIPVLLLILVVVVGWVKIYDYFQVQRWGFGIETFLYGNQKINVKDYSKSRTEPMKIALDYVVDHDLIFFGVGAGNASGSFQENMTGKFAKKFAKYGVRTTQITNLIWELGLGGVFMFALFFFMLFWDAVKYSSCKNDIGILALAMITITFLLPGTFFYKQILERNVLTFPFFLLSGFLACGDYYRNHWDDDDG